MSALQPEPIRGATRLSRASSIFFTTPRNFRLVQRPSSASLESSLQADFILPRALGPVLNAFRHHWNLHTSCPANYDISARCSTPFGIIGIFTRGIRCPRSSRPVCSTPFGIIGIFTLQIKRKRTLMAVLNAFRHHWNLHQCATPVGLEKSGAQRLSASLESSLVGDQLSRRHRKCSTPFGIIGIFTIRQLRLPRHSAVLNAFRHHWNLHTALRC